MPGVFEIRPELISDERGFFARSWCQNEFEAQGSEPKARPMQYLGQQAKGNVARNPLSTGPNIQRRKSFAARGARFTM